MNVLRRFLILFHRYLGIPLSFVFVLWFVSGIAMIYAGGMPQLTPLTRIERLPPLPLDRVALTPLEAANAAGVGASPEEAVLGSVMDRPAYRFAVGFGTTTVFADTGEPLEEIDVDTSRAVASRFLQLPESALHYERTLDEPDQWTLLLRRALPLHKFTADDESATEIYVSPALAEVSLATTRAKRALAWVGTIPHWLYFTPLRVNQPLWYWLVVGLSSAGCVLAVMGLILGVTQFRKSKPFRLSQSIRYTGLMRWHYVLGVVFGLFALTWVFSGLLSMEPFAWTSATGLSVRRDAFSGGALDLAAFSRFDAAGWRRALDGRVLKEVELKKIQDESFYLARYTVVRSDGCPRASAPTLQRVRPQRARPTCYSPPARCTCATSRLRRVAARATRDGRARRRDRRARAPQRVRRLLLFARPASTVAGAAREVRRPGRNVGLHRPATFASARGDPSAESRSSAGFTTACTASIFRSGTTAGRSGTSA